MTTPLRKGALIRLLTPLASGWIGYGLVSEDSLSDDLDAIVAFSRLDHEPDETCLALRSQVELVYQRKRRVR